MKKLLKIMLIMVLAAGMMTVSAGAATLTGDGREIYEPAQPLAPDGDMIIIEDPSVPLTDAPVIDASRQIEEIDDSEVPLSSLPEMALVNLVLVAGTLVSAVALSVAYLRIKDKTEAFGSSEAAVRNGLLRMLSLAVGMGAVIVFYLTEPVSAKVVLVDKWTFAAVAIAAVQCVVVFVAARARSAESVNR